MRRIRLIFGFTLLAAACANDPQPPASGQVTATRIAGGALGHGDVLSSPAPSTPPPSTPSPSPSDPSVASPSPTPSPANPCQIPAHVKCKWIDEYCEATDGTLDDDEHFKPNCDFDHKKQVCDDTKCDLVISQTVTVKCK